jgi:hypothetical protein
MDAVKGRAQQELAGASSDGASNPKLGPMLVQALAHVPGWDEKNFQVNLVLACSGLGLLLGLNLSCCGAALGRCFTTYWTAQVLSRVFEVVALVASRPEGNFNRREASVAIGALAEKV